MNKSPSLSLVIILFSCAGVLITTPGCSTLVAEYDYNDFKQERGFAYTVDFDIQQKIKGTTAIYTAEGSAFYPATEPSHLKVVEYVDYRMIDDLLLEPLMVASLPLAALLGVPAYTKEEAIGVAKCLMPGINADTEPWAFYTKDYSYTVIKAKDGPHLLKPQRHEIIKSRVRIRVYSEEGKQLASGPCYLPCRVDLKPLATDALENGKDTFQVRVKIGKQSEIITGKHEWIFDYQSCDFTKGDSKQNRQPQQSR